MNKAFIHAEAAVLKMEPNMMGEGSKNQSQSESGNNGDDFKTKGIANNYKDSIKAVKPLQEAVSAMTRDSLTIRRVRNYLNVHTEPNTFSDMITRLHNGDVVEYLNQQSDDWVMIGSSDGVVGWVRTNYVEGLPE